MKPDEQTATDKGDVMANFELSKRIKADQELDVEKIKCFILERLSKSCKYEIVSASADSLSVKGGVKESLFTPVIKFQASFEIKVEGDKARININGNSGPNWHFWIFFLVGLFTGIFLLVGIGLFLIQCNKPKETCEGILNAIDTEFSSM